MKPAYPHRERLDDPKGDAVIVPTSFYRLRTARRVDKYDALYRKYLEAGKIPPTPKRVVWGDKR
jgi:hypothetical protein